MKTINNTMTSALFFLFFSSVASAAAVNQSLTCRLVVDGVVVTKTLEIERPQSDRVTVQVTNNGFTCEALGLNFGDTMFTGEPGKSGIQVGIGHMALSLPRGEVVVDDKPTAWGNHLRDDSAPESWKYPSRAKCGCFID